ncbi:S-layer homology domain-containing protein [Saccharibacillus alkalitolerans]|uniref:S-layer homology domain-containing protein n=1 Tax=Saccharibacillus alkalitolerans TaxID=2705290 RepID=A0ABX0F836_9BACL|nr:S-layer homology domain-containing protein [Saccharibacillus alkalitolerans]NGZ76065.1 S-layer homology domain-containing protein [Saccharibacillus alkalitolerans]
MKKTAGLLLSSLLVSSTIWTGAAFGESAPASSSSVVQSSIFKDLNNHWSKQAVEKWQNRGIIKGAAEGKFAPERTLTRAEWVTLVNRTFQLNRQKAEAPSDVKEGSWYAADVKAALTAGYIGITGDGTFQADRPLTREEAAVTLANLLRLSTVQPDTDAFADFKTSTEANGAPVYAAVEAGLLKGYADKTFRPHKALTRAEAAVLIDRAAEAYGMWIGEQGEYGPADGVRQEKGSVLVNTPGVTLQNLEIAGDLVIGKNVGEGDVTLKNVTVRGNTYVYGGGEHSIHIEGSHLVNIIVDKKEGTVRIVAQGETTVQEVVVRTGANLEAEKGVTVNKVELTNELPANSEVRLAGYFNTVNVQAYSLALDIPSGSIGELNVSKDAEGAVLNTGSESRILTLLLNAAAKVAGVGKIDSATINAKDITFDKSPTAVKVGKDVPADTKVSVGGQQVAAGAASAPAAAPASQPAAPSAPAPAAPSGGNGGETAAPAPAPTPEPIPWQPVKVELRDKTVSVGESVYFTSSIDGTAYISSRGIAYYDLPTLALGVESGEVQTKQVKAGELNYFSTSDLRNIEYFRNYEFNVTVYAESNKGYGTAEVEVFDESEELVRYPVVSHYGGEPEYFSFNYNRRLGLAPGRELNEIVQLKLDGEESYKTFDSSLGTVEIVGGKVFIRPLQDQLGRNFMIKLTAGAVVTSDGQLNKEHIHGPDNSFTRIKLLSHGGKAYATVKKGETIEFSVEYGGIVYLAPQIISGGLDEYDRKVAEGWAKKRVVTNEEANLPLTISTEGLSKGAYNLHIWGGRSIYIEIED